MQWKDRRARRAVDLTQSRSASVFSGGVAGSPPQKGSDETQGSAAGEGFPLKSTNSQKRVSGIQNASTVWACAPFRRDTRKLPAESGRSSSSSGQVKSSQAKR